jgi:carbon storage regulator CsrA
MMLVLSRRIGETVVVGGGGGMHRMLKVSVLEVTNGCVRLGFEVDPEIPVHRLEVWERIRAEEPARAASLAGRSPGRHLASRARHSRS